MELGDKRWFKGQVDALAINFRQEVGPALYQALWIGLEDIGKANVETAIRLALRECEFFPPVAKLRDLAGHGKRAPLPEYFKSAEAELERIETCRFHEIPSDEHKPNPDGAIEWCRKCRRVMKGLAGGGQPPPLRSVGGGKK